VNKATHILTAAQPLDGGGYREAINATKARRKQFTLRKEGSNDQSVERRGGDIKQPIRVYFGDQRTD